MTEEDKKGKNTWRNTEKNQSNNVLKKIKQNDEVKSVWVNLW